MLQYHISQEDLVIFIETLSARLDAAHTRQPSGTTTPRIFN